MLRTTRSRSLVRTGAAGASALLMAGAALLAGAPAGAAAGSAGIAEYAPPASTTLTVPKPYDDLSFYVCGATPNGTARIYSADTGRDIYSLSGDAMEFVGRAKGCQVPYAPTDVAEFGFLGSELHWSLAAAGDSTQDLGSGEVLQDGRNIIPTTSRIERTMTAGDDGAKLSYGTVNQVQTPNSLDWVGGGYTVILHVIDPHLQLTKQVCLAGTGCDAADDAQWGTTTTVATGSDVQWRLTAKNTGNIALADVRVSDDVLTGGTATGNDCAGASVVASLAPGASAAVTCSTAGVKGAGDVVNSAKLTSTFTDPSGGRILSRFTDGVGSNIDSASVRTVAPAIALVKQVCATGTGCDVADDAQWTDRVTVPFGTDAQWRLTVTNTGNTTLLDVVPTQENLTGGVEGPSKECESLAFGTLAAGQKKSLDCTTTGIVDTTQDAVNHAVVRGMPADDAGTPYDTLYPAGVSTPEATAAVATSVLVLEPEPGVTGPPITPAPGDETTPEPPATGVVVSDGLPPAPAGNGVKAVPSATHAEALASTGLDATLGGAAALLLLSTGAAVLVVRRRAVRGTVRQAARG
ncbi:hypothetical protein P5G50_07835 [Leifsonia sp. F6_8S_P_1B]|uniref:DUF7507 domain-containing protein n=1 Tax=Leifsonia williamsii TaxID=3035919 RepID=A0ABT8KD12_9MICO|nr:hypothetical protein [Leifsonia williamsii]MDN4614357.1 hypothetical protein [Leifsonia williamsii]